MVSHSHGFLNVLIIIIVSIYWVPYPINALHTLCHSILTHFTDEKTESYRKTRLVG